MKCPKCKKGTMKYHPDNFYASCTRCDYRNGRVRFIRKVIAAQEQTPTEAEKEASHG
jgi:hypothetical protein